MLRDAIGYTSLSSLDRTLNNARYISGVFRPLALPFIRALRHPTYYQDNARPHVVGIVRTFLDTETVWLFFLNCTFTRSFANRKCLVNGCRATDSSPYASHYG
ncbi:transposable element Tcb1 transposase [Trichonephila clavipes]|nr:transposable element Tcb1 transposase [Trichonephila clavipes]